VEEALEESLLGAEVEGIAKPSCVPDCCGTVERRSSPLAADKFTTASDLAGCSGSSGCSASSAECSGLRTVTLINDSFLDVNAFGGGGYQERARSALLQYPSSQDYCCGH
jgi:hypothetical protein